MEKGSSVYREALEAYKSYGYDENSTGIKTDWALTTVEWAQAFAISGICKQAQEKKVDFERWAAAVVFEKRDFIMKKKSSTGILKTAKKHCLSRNPSWCPNADPSS